MAQKIDIVKGAKRFLDGLDLNNVQDMELKIENFTRKNEFYSSTFLESDIVGVELNLKVYWKNTSKTIKL